MPDDSSPLTWFQDWKAGGFAIGDDEISSFLAELPGQDLTSEPSRKREASPSSSNREQPNKKTITSRPSEVFILMSKQWTTHGKPTIQAHGAFSNLEKAELKVEKLRKNFYILDDDLLTHDLPSASVPYCFEYEEGHCRTKIWVEKFVVDGPDEGGRDLSTSYF